MRVCRSVADREGGLFIGLGLVTLHGEAVVGDCIGEALSGVLSTDHLDHGDADRGGAGQPPGLDAGGDRASSSSVAAGRF